MENADAKDHPAGDPVGVRLGAIVTLTGSNAKVGSGILASIQHVLAEADGDLRRRGLAVTLMPHNDFGDSAMACRALDACIDDGCVAVLGPNDSTAMREALRRRGTYAIPKLTGFATATNLARERRDGFYRVTTSSHGRAVRLVMKLSDSYPKARRVFVYTLGGPPGCYAEGLREDVLAALADADLEPVDHRFALFDPVEPPDDGDAPVIVCSPSAEAVELIRLLRQRRYRGPVFAFGSNTNFLVKEALGTVVVADLDRCDADPIVRRVLDGFARRFPRESEPSLSTMTAASVLVAALRLRPAECWREPTAGRRLLIKALDEESLPGVQGPVSFRRDGEMIGHEAISLLRVCRTGGGLGFLPVRDNDRPIVYNPFSVWSTGKIVGGIVIGTISFVLGILGFLGIGASDLLDLIQR